MTRFIRTLARAALAILAFGLGLFAALPARAENLFFIDNPGSGIYSVDINFGGPATRLVTLPGTQYNATLATRPSDGMLFWLDSNGANPNLWRWDPSNPNSPPVPLGTPGPTATSVLRLGFDVNGRLLAMDQSSSTLWNLSTTNGSILGIIPLSGTLPNGGGDLCLDPTNNTLYMVSNTELYTVSTTGQSTLLGTISGLSGGNSMTGCAVTANGTLIVSQSNVPQLSRITLGATPSATLLPNSTGFASIGDLSSTSALVADLSVTKTAVNSTPGATASYVVTVSNAGPDYATDVRVLDAVPTGLSFTSGTASQGAYSATQAIIGANTYPAGTWRVGRLAANQSATLTLTYSVTQSTPVTNTAQVSYSDMFDPDSLPGNSVVGEDDEAVVVITPSADVQISKTAASSFGVGTNGTFLLTVRNSGLAATSGTYTVTDTLPAGLTFVSAAGTNWTCTPNTPAGANVVGGSQVSCSSGTVLAGGASANPITLTVAVTAPALPSVTNSASVSGGEPASNNGNNSDSVTVAVCPGPCVDLVPTKTLNVSALSVGTISTYTITVSNLGALTTTGAYTIVDNLPTGLTLATVPAGTGWTCTQSGVTNTVNGTIVSCSRATTITGGGVSSALTFNVNVAAAALPQVTNTATVANGGDTYAGNNTTSLTSDVGSFDLQITKVASNDFTVGATSGYLITVTNVGTAASPAGVTTTLSDTLPTNLTLNARPTIAPTGGGWACTGAAGNTNFTCTTTSSLAAGASYQFTVPIANLSNNVGTSPSLSNTATVTNASEPATLTGNNSATATDFADLVITKAHTDPFALNGNSVYSLNVSNIGTVTIRGITTVTDVLPVGLTFQSATGTGWTCPYTAATRTITCTRAIGNVDPGGSLPPIIVTVTATTSGSLTNTASVSNPSEPAGKTGNNTASDPTNVLLPPTWSKAFAPTTIASGGTATLTITINKPAGATSLDGIAFVDPLPSGMTVATPLTATNTCGGTLTGVAGDTAIALSNGTFTAASCAINVVVGVNLTAAAPQTDTNTTGPLSTTNAGNAAAVSATLVVTAPTNAVLTKATSPNPIGVGETTTLKFTIVNKATRSNPVAFTDTFPSANIVAATGAAFTNTCGGTPTYTAPVGATPGKISLTGVNLAGNVNCTLSYPITGTAAGSYVNNSSNISGLTNLTATTLSDTLVVQQAALTKDFSPSAILVGGTSTVTFTISNTTEQPAFNNLTFTEALPTNLTLASAPTTPQCGGTVAGTAGSGTITVTGAFLLANQSSCTVVAPVTSTVVNTYVNANTNVTASSNINKSVNATLAVAPFPSLSKTVTVLNDPLNGTSNPKAIPGAEMEYTVVVSNPGAITLDSGTVKVTDILPPNTSLYIGPTGPVTSFTTSAPGLTLTYTSPGDTSDDIAFSNSAGPSYTFGYTPVPVNNYDAAVTALQFSPKGTMPGGSTATIKFKVQVR